MDEHLWWYLSRSTAVVALVLLVLSLVWGVLLSTRALREVDRPAWLLSLHTWLSGTAIVMTFIHASTLMFDQWAAFSPVDLLVPGVATWAGATQIAEIGTAIGVVSAYVLLTIHVSSLLRRRMSRRAWSLVHRLSFPLVFAVLIHAGWTGTDTSNRAYQALAVVLAMMTVVATVLRLITPSRTRRTNA